MNENIYTAIESICEDIASTNNAEGNRMRAEAILMLAFSDFILPTVATGVLISENEETTNATASYSGNAKGSTIPKPGEQFVYNGIAHIILGEEQGGILAIKAEALDEEKPFDTKNSNDWRVSTLRKDLNENYIKQYNKGDLLPYVSDLTADNGMKDYGTSEDYIFVPSCDLIRKYRDYLPEYKTDDIVTLTPWSCTPHYAYIVRCLDSSGTLDVHYAYNSSGVAPACLFNPSIFK